MCCFAHYILWFYWRKFCWQSWEYNPLPLKTPTFSRWFSANISGCTDAPWCTEFNCFVVRWWGGLLGVANVSSLLELLKDDFRGNVAIVFPPKWQGWTHGTPIFPQGDHLTPLTRIPYSAFKRTMRNKFPPRWVGWDLENQGQTPTKPIGLDAITFVWRCCFVFLDKGLKKLLRYL